MYVPDIQFYIHSVSECWYLFMHIQWALQHSVHLCVISWLYTSLADMCIYNCMCVCFFLLLFPFHSFLRPSFLFSVPHSCSPSLIPVLRPSFRFSVPHSCSPSLIPVLRPSFLFSVPHSCSPLLIPVLRPSFLFSVPPSFSLPLLHTYICLQLESALVNCYLHWPHLCFSILAISEDGHISPNFCIKVSLTVPTPIQVKVNMVKMIADVINITSTYNNMHELTMHRVHCADAYSMIII